MPTPSVKHEEIETSSRSIAPRRWSRAPKRASDTGGAGVDSASYPAALRRPAAPLRALIFDSRLDQYMGVVAYVRVMDARSSRATRSGGCPAARSLKSTASGSSGPKWSPPTASPSGEVGYLTASMKTVGDTRVGDTITDASRPATLPLLGYREVHPMVFCGLFPSRVATAYDVAGRASAQLNDAVFTYEPESL